MTHKTENYNLLMKDWIPILRTNGKLGRVGIRRALLEAGSIRQIAASNPMDNVALLRLLLAVLQWCKPTLTDEERRELETKEGIPGHWLQKLGSEEKPDSAFDLFGEAERFYQDRSAKGRPVAVTNLLHDLPSGSKIAHFRHARDYRDRMCLPCCALGLVRWPGVASAGTAGGGQSMTASINGNTPAYSVSMGGGLLATLLVTWPTSFALEGDAPIWDGANEESPLGFLKGMTWRSRRVLLAPPDAEGRRDLSPGRCSYCGDRADRLVRSIVFRPGWKKPSKEPWLNDPHLLRITRKEATSSKNKVKEIVPSWPNPNKALEDHVGIWRSVLEGLLQRSKSSPATAMAASTTLLACSQALYKHVGKHSAFLPPIGPDAAQCLLDEMEWLREVTAITAAARSANWHDPPKGHFVVRALCAPGAKGHAIRSNLCARSPLTERELQIAFLNLAYDLAVEKEADSSGIEQVLVDWRREVRRILFKHIEHAVKATTPGSPLRRREALQRVGNAVRDGVHQIEQQAKQAAKRAKRGPGKRGGA